MFWILAAAMLLAALAFVLWPLRGGRGDAGDRARRAALHRAHRSGALDDAELQAKLAALAPASTAPSTLPRWLAPLLALSLSVAAILLYRGIGEPRAMDPEWQGAMALASGQAPAPTDDGSGQGPDMEKAVAGLAERLRAEPDDLEGWMLLGRAYKTMERFSPAREALANAFRLAPENPDVLVEYAEAQVLASDARRFEGESLQMLERALQLQPENQRGRWLMGIAHYQEGRYGEAAASWERLLAQIPADAEPRAALEQRIADARQRAGGTPAAPSAAAPPAVASTTPAATTPTPAASTATPSDGPRITVEVDISPELKSQVGASDVLFVFARAAQGPRMPLAIQRLPASSLPVTVTLDDSASMMPAMKLSTMPQVVIGARVSKSGQATPQAGDFEAISDPIANSHRDTVQLRIERVLP
jgi:cytochrome c-type biogenesis protein CcmH